MVLINNKQDLIDYFQQGCKKEDQLSIGVEHEKFLFDGYLNKRINSFLYKQNETREWQTIHTSSLNEIFFNTLDEIDCFQDPFSILR